MANSYHLSLRTLNAQGQAVPGSVARLTLLDTQGAVVEDRLLQCDATGHLDHSSLVNTRHPTFRLTVMKQGYANAAFEGGVAWKSEGGEWFGVLTRMTLTMTP